MGFLRESTPLPWEDALDRLKYVRDHVLETEIEVCVCVCVWCGVLPK